MLSEARIGSFVISLFLVASCLAADKELSNQRLLRYKAEPGRELRYLLVREILYRNNVRRPKLSNTTVVDLAILRVAKWALVKEGIEVHWYVEYVNGDWKRLPAEQQRSRGVPSFQFRNKLSPTGAIVYPPGVPKGQPGTPNIFPAPGIFPTLAEHAVSPGDKWQEELSLVLSPFDETLATQFPLRVEYELQEYEKRLGHHCIKITYTYEGRFDAHEHPDRFEASKLDNLRLRYSIVGHGEAYFAYEAGFLVEKREDVTRTMREEKRIAQRNETVWKPIRDSTKQIHLTMSLQKVGLSVKSQE